MALIACAGRKLIEPPAIGSESERHRPWQLGERIAGGAAADAEPAHHDRDAGRVGPARDGLGRPRVERRRPRRVRRHGLGRRAEGRRAERWRRDRRRQGVARLAVVGLRVAARFGVRRRDHHLVALATGAIDDRDRAPGGRG